MIGSVRIKSGWEILQTARELMGLFLLPMTWKNLRKLNFCQIDRLWDPTEIEIVGSNIMYCIVYCKVCPIVEDILSRQSNNNSPFLRGSVTTLKWHCVIDNAFVKWHARESSPWGTLVSSWTLKCNENIYFNGKKRSKPRKATRFPPKKSTCRIKPAIDHFH